MQPGKIIVSRKDEREWSFPIQWKIKQTLENHRTLGQLISDIKTNKMTGEWAQVMIHTTWYIVNFQNWKTELVMMKMNGEDENGSGGVGGGGGAEFFVRQGC